MVSNTGDNQTIELPIGYILDHVYLPALSSKADTTKKSICTSHVTSYKVLMEDDRALLNAVNPKEAGMDIHPSDSQSYSLRVDVITSLYPNNYIDDAVAKHMLGRIVVYDMEDELTVGTIVGYRITSFDVASVVFHADRISSDFVTAAEWLYQEEDAFLNSVVLNK